MEYSKETLNLEKLTHNLDQYIEKHGIYLADADVLDELIEIWNGLVEVSYAQLFKTE